MLSIDNNYGKINFKQNDKIKRFANLSYTADQFITDSNLQEEKRLKGNFLSKNLGSLTGSYGGCGLFLIGEIICLGIKRRAEKNGPISPDLKKALRNKFLKILAGFAIAGTAVIVGVQKWQNKIIDDDSPLPKDYLEKYGQDTSASLGKNNFRSSAIAAQYNQINGTIEINKNYLHDPIGKLLVKKYMKHELQHARQSEMVAALDNGVEKLNYAIFKNTADFFKKNSIALSQINDVINDVNNDETGKYDNVTIPSSGAKINFKDYIKAIEILINNEDAKPEDIPMLIDAEHYKKAVEKRGPLSEEEKVKAEQYYQAILKYPVMAGLNILNPFSGYRSNLLEKEARKASRSKTGKI